MQPAVVIVMDSSSTDGYVGSCEPGSWMVQVLEQHHFDHGGTRNKAFALAATYGVEYVVCLTQDAILADVLAVEKLLEPFADAQVAAVCGRQLPKYDANVRARFARLFNYPQASWENSEDHIPARGIKAAFMSNSFAAYRLSAFLAVDGFPERIIFGEDMYLAARLILSGWKTAYQGDASAVHSHNNTLRDDFRRYFDIGVFHRQTPTLLQNFGKASGEGFHYSIQEIKYVWRNNFLQLPMVFLEIFTKFTAYKLGYHFKLLPVSLIKRMSLNRNYWAHG